VREVPAPLGRLARLMENEVPKRHTSAPAGQRIAAARQTSLTALW
jgi:hypothetical protein